MTTPGDFPYDAFRRRSSHSPPTNVGVSDHACWGYTSADERAALVSSWLTEGRRLGQRCLYVGEGTRAELIAELATVPDLVGAVEAGALSVAPASVVYDLRAPIDADTQLAVYAAAVEEAMRDGYRGLRVAADISPLLDDDRRRAAHLRWEQIADRYIADNPLAPLCIYDVERVGPIDAIVCAHPLQGPLPGPFALYGHRASRVVLEGELDDAAWGTFAEVLDAMPVDDQVIDAAGVSFVDTHCGAILHDALLRRRAQGHAVRIVGAPNALRRIWQVCDFDPALLVGEPG